jgi:hypothetical protein
MDRASEAILALKPVTFRYKEHVDPERGPQFGLVAEDVAGVNPELVVRDAEGKVYTRRSSERDVAQPQSAQQWKTSDHRATKGTESDSRISKQIEALTGLQR